MLREETFGTLEWEDGKTVRGLVVVWRDGEDGDAFRGWLASAHRGAPEDYRMPPNLEELAREAPWRGLIIAARAEASGGGGQGPATLLLRGMECRAMVLHARLAALPSMTHESRYSVEYQVMGLQGVDPCIA